MKPFVYEISGLHPLIAFKAINHMPYSLLLDSADRNHPSSRYSFVMGYPIETIETKNRQTTVTNWEQQLTIPGDPFEILQDRMDAWVGKTQTVGNLPPFQGGAAGLFGYDLGRTIEDIPETAKDNEKIPDMAVGLYDQVYAYDHEQNKGWIITHARNHKEAETKRNFLLKILTNEEQIAEEPPHNPKNMEWTANFTTSEYEQNVRKVIDYIYEGDIFQANLSQRFDTPKPEEFDAFTHYARLREVNPAPYATFMNLGGIIISSASPERFLSVDENGEVLTQPIKGTRPRVEDPQTDRKNREDLLNSEKDRAENIMIVDLLRNDLSKVCQADSISANNLCELETFAGVHHLVSTVRGKLKTDKTPLDLLKACFPGGSITGAPKIRAMEIIEELEPTRRGPYCGSMAYIGYDGQMDSSILIRTIIYDDKNISIQAGGGIVADSDPATEYQETLDKAASIFKSFETEAEEAEKTATAAKNDKDIAKTG